MASKQKPSPPQEDATWQDALVRILLRFQRFTRDVAGILAIALALMTLLALAGLTGGALLTPWSAFLRLWLGFGAVLAVFLLAWVGWLVLRQRQPEASGIPWGRVLALEMAAFAALTLLTIVQGVSLERAEAGQDGGLIGWGLAEFLGLAIGPFWRAVLIVVLFLWGIVVGFGLLRPVLAWMRTILAPDGVGVPPQPHPGRAADSRGEHPPEEAPSAPDRPAAIKPKKPKKVDIPAEYRNKFRLPPQKKPSQPPPPRDDRLPPLSLLSGGQTIRPQERHINQTAGLIVKTLAEFGIPAEVVDVQVGPTVTMFAVKPGYIEKPGAGGDIAQQKVRVAQISSLSRDLALALSASRLRIQAPVPGRSFVGIEVPNLKSSQVRLRPILQSEPFYKAASPLALALGLDVSGNPVVADLATMPHLLIAGTTGSGKSVCISAITTCLVMNNSPEDLRIIMIDPKKVELVRFNGLPHLLGRVETDLDRILGVLRWTVAEMDRRYKLLEKYRSRNIFTFNKKMRQRKQPPEAPMPHIVVLIDELADLMMSAAEQTEPALVRLAQLARATGIHLVVATQRPSTDVVTGLIKANFPARLAFAVASSVDSRVILDSGGAESLLGNGDMLFLPPDAPSPIRAQGALVTDQEIEKVIQHWQRQYADEEEAPPWEQMLAEEAMLATRDDLVERAIEIVREAQRASASMLQRRLRIGYPRAARLIDELEDLGIVGPSQGGGREREVLIEPPTQPPGQETG